MDKLINQVMVIVQERMTEEFSGHDYWHVHRVYQNSLLILEEEKKQRDVDEVVVKLAALLHDIGDYKVTGKHETLTEIPNEILKSLSVDEEIIYKVLQVINEISFHKQIEELSTYEAKIVQDADRLDAIGAIGIARAFAYGGANQRDIWNPNVPPNLNMTTNEYITNKGSSINHFYEKLLLLKDKMNTPTAKKVAEQRHRFMEEYLQQFYMEWEGK